jgi:heme exporter protein C
MGPSPEEHRHRSIRPALGTLALVAMAVALALGLVVAPAEAIQGQAQRLMYVHVPAAWTAFAAFALVLVASVAVLMRRHPRWDARAQAAAELGVGMTALAIVEGSIWGHTAWGVWWTWDARLVTTAVLLLLYLGYLGVRGLPGDRVHVSRRAAVVGVVGFVQVPVVHFSVLWWRTLHQPPTLLQPTASPPISPLMLTALLAAVTAFMLGGAWFLRRRVAQLVPVEPSPSADDADTRPVSIVVTRGAS